MANYMELKGGYGLADEIQETMNENMLKAVEVLDKIKMKKDDTKVRVVGGGYGLAEEIDVIMNENSLKANEVLESSKFKNLGMKSEKKGFNLGNLFKRN